MADLITSFKPTSFLPDLNGMINAGRVKRFFSSVFLKKRKDHVQEDLPQILAEPVALEAQADNGYVRGQTFLPDEKDGEEVKEGMFIPFIVPSVHHVGNILGRFGEIYSESKSYSKALS